MSWLNSRTSKATTLQARRARVQIFYADLKFKSIHFSKGRGNLKIGINEWWNILKRCKLLWNLDLDCFNSHEINLIFRFYLNWRNIICLLQGNVDIYFDYIELFISVFIPDFIFIFSKNLEDINRLRTNYLSLEAFFHQRKDVHP